MTTCDPSLGVDDDLVLVLFLPLYPACCRTRTSGLVVTSSGRCRRDGRTVGCTPIVVLVVVMTPIVVPVLLILVIKLVIL